MSDPPEHHGLSWARHSSVASSATTDSTGSAISGQPCMSLGPTSPATNYVGNIVRNRYSRFMTMNPDKSDNSNAPLSTAAQYILLSLAGRELHGYGILQEIAKLSENTYRLGPGTLYDNLKRLMDAGMVEDVPRAENKNQADDRRFYRITSKGRRVLAAEISRLESMVAVHSRLPKPKSV